MGYKWAKLKKRIYPTASDYMTACDKADNDDVQSRDVRDMMYALMKLEELNDKVRKDVKIRNTASMICEYSIKTLAEPTPADTEAIAAVIQRLKKAIRIIRGNALNMQLYGSMLLEFNWDNQGADGKKYPKLAKKYLPTEIEKLDENIIAIYNESNGQITGRTEVDLSDVTSANMNFIGSVSDGNFRGGILRVVELMMIYANDQTREWFDFNKLLKGIIQGMYARGATEGEKKEAKEATASVAQHNIMVTSEAIKFVYQSITDPKGSTSFKEIIERFEKAADFTILGQDATTEIPKYGARNALEIISQVSSDLFANDMWHIEELVNNLLLQDYILNVNSTALTCPWEFKINIPESINRAEKMDVIDSLATNGIPTRSDELYSFIGFTKPKDAPDMMFDKPKENTGFM